MNIISCPVGATKNAVLYRSRVPAAEAKKAEGASEETRLIPKPLLYYYYYYYFFLPLVLNSQGTEKLCK